MSYPGHSFGGGLTPLQRCSQYILQPQLTGQVNGSKYCYVLPIIQFRYTIKELQILLFNINYSIHHYSFVYTQLNGSKYYYESLTIQTDTKLQLIVRLHFYRSGKYGVPLSLPLLPGLLWPRVVAPMRVPSIDQIDDLKLFVFSWTVFEKKKNLLRINDTRNLNMNVQNTQFLNL